MTIDMKSIHDSDRTLVIGATAASRIVNTNNRI